MKLSEAVALARAAKTRVHGALTSLHRESQKVDLYAGLARTYEPLTEDNEKLPPESKKVQLQANVILAELRRLLTERWDTEANVTYSNANAVANVVLSDGTTLLENVPATYLLYLEKALEDLHTFVAKMPTLDPGEDWTWDGNRSVFASRTTQTASQKRVPRPLVLVEATERHPAQVTTYDDVTVQGYWSTTKLSGALAADHRHAILLRVNELRDAVKTARERANQLVVTETRPAATLLDYALNGAARTS